MILILALLAFSSCACGGERQEPEAKADAGTQTVHPAGSGLVWPNSASSANSDPWIAAHHDEIREMQPRFLVVNFANGLGEGGLDNTAGGQVTEAQVRAKAQHFLDMLSRASTYQPRLHPDAKPFLRPQLVKLANLQDHNGHANSDLFPRGPADPKTGYHQVGYNKLFSDEYAPHWGFRDGERFLTLGEIVNRGLVNEVIMVANQVDGKTPNPPGQVTNHILEVAMVAQAYDAKLQPIAGEYVRNGAHHDRQKMDMAQATREDDNSMLWIGRSLRIYFMNVSRGPGCLLHSLGHEFEFRYNEARIHSPGKAWDGDSPHPWLRPYFRRYADFEMDKRFGAPFKSLYEDDRPEKYTYADPKDGACTALLYPASGHFPAGRIQGYEPVAGNVHYPPGAAHGYDYHPKAAVYSRCETFMKPGEAAQPFSKENYAYLTSDPAIDKDGGGDFLVYWYQNMPGLQNEARDSSGRAMRNWWVFMYY